MMRSRARLTRAAILVIAQIIVAGLALTACVQRTPEQAQAKKESAEEFVARANRELAALDHESEAASFTQATYITPDTEMLAAKAEERLLAKRAELAQQSKQYASDKSVSPAAARAMMLIRVNVAAPAPLDPAKGAELSAVTARLTSMYGEGKYCPPKESNQGPDSCKNLDQLSEVLAKSRNFDELVEAWQGWHDVGAPMREPYSRFVELANEGARALDFPDLGVMWRARYDMTPQEADQEAERLWQQVKPLYDSLHCHARAQLARKYGEDKVPAGQPIPAHLFGNMWAQQWNKIFDDILKPYPDASIESADRLLVAKKWDAVKIAQSAESAYESLGFPKLPESFWKRSMLVRPRDREVVCHASAWAMDDKDDVRIKMCIQPQEEDLFTVYHELGHVYYYLMYENLPFLFKTGAHDGFHEAIGDTVNLSVTPGYLAQIGLVSAVKPSEQAVINQQMKVALEKVAFLPFGRLIDQWRWRVFSGDITPENYNSTWWELRRRYQGIAPPVARTEQDFDPGAKYHVPANTPYLRYFLSYILQFQFHKALCAASGHKGPLHECSVFGNDEAGKRYREMLSLGASQPWQDTMEKLTGARRMDASAILEYFQPLSVWLEEQNQGRQCGWQ